MAGEPPETPSEKPSDPATEGKGRRTYSTRYKTIWVSLGILQIGVIVQAWLAGSFLFLWVLFLPLGAWSLRSPYRFIVLPEWVRFLLGLVIVLGIWGAMTILPGPRSVSALVFSPLILSCFFQYEGAELHGEEDVFSREYWAAVGRLFEGLRFSIFVLFGLLFGTGLAAPIVLEQLRLVLREGPGAGSLVAAGVYLLLVGILGTWTSLGAFGVWAGRCGGRPLRFLIQVFGIVLTAFLTLPLALLVTWGLMWWKERRAAE